MVWASALVKRTILLDVCERSSRKAATQSELPLGSGTYCLGLASRLNCVRGSWNWSLLAGSWLNGVWQLGKVDELWFFLEWNECGWTNCLYADSDWFIQVKDRGAEEICFEDVWRIGE